MLQYIDYYNKKGDKVRISDGLETQFAFYDISGVSPPQAAINTTSTAGYDGSVVNNTSVEKRNIVLTIQILGDATAGKKALYSVFKSKQQGELFYKSDGWEVKIPCYTEKLEIVPTARPLKAVISLICPQPYWEALDALHVELQSITNAFYFPLVLLEEGIPLGIINPQYAINVENDGDVTLGFTVEFIANNGTVSNPRLINTQTLEYLALDMEMQAGDVITICTTRSNKRVTLTRNGVDYNYFNSLADGSTFLQLDEGDNEFQFTADGGESNLLMRMSYVPLYIGV